MIQLLPHMRVFIHLEPVDFRCGIDGLAGICRLRLKQDPMSGAVFVFINRRRTGVKLIVYDGQGFWICYKRLSRCKFRFWPKNEVQLTGPQMQVLLYDGDPAGSNMALDWRSVQDKTYSGACT